MGGPQDTSCVRPFRCPFRKSFSMRICFQTAFFFVCWSGCSPSAASVPCSLCTFLEPSRTPALKPYEKGSFRKALRMAKAQQWKRANQSMKASVEGLQRSVQKLFHPAESEETNPKGIETFLNRHLYGKRPELVMGPNDFYLHPTLAISWASMECNAGIPGSSWQSLQHLRHAAHPLAPLATAISFLASERPIPETVWESIDTSLLLSSFEGQVVVAVQTLLTGSPEERSGAIGRVQENCRSPRQCAWGDWLEARSISKGTSP